jgi:hypothetical protein
MDEQTRQLLHDAAPPVPTGTDFDRLWQQAVRQRRLQRVGQAAATVVAIALAGLVLPFGWGDSLPLLGRGDNGVVTDDELASAPLSEWDVVDVGTGGSILGASSENYRLSVFAIEGDRWCIAGRPGGSEDFGFGPLEPDLAARLLCHEARRPGSGPIGTLGALQIGERTVHWATLAPGVDRIGISADFGGGMRPVESAHLAGGGGLPFMLWVADTTGRTPRGFEVPDPTGRAEPVIIEAPEPLPAEVHD